MKRSIDRGLPPVDYLEFKKTLGMLFEWAKSDFDEVDREMYEQAITELVNRIMNDRGEVNIRMCIAIASVNLIGVFEFIEKMNETKSNPYFVSMEEFSKWKM